MNAAPSEEKLQRSGIGAITTLTTLSLTGGVGLVVEAGACEAITATLQRPIDSPGVVADCALAIRALAKGGEEIRDRLGAVGVEALVAAMTAHLDAAALQVDIVEALQGLVLSASDKNNRNRVRAANAPAALVAALTAHRADAACALKCVETLCVWASAVAPDLFFNGVWAHGQDVMMLNYANAGVCEAVMAVAAAFSTDVAILRLAIVCIQITCKDMTCRARFGAAGACELVVGTLLAPLPKPPKN